MYNASCLEMMNISRIHITCFHGEMIVIINIILLSSLSDTLLHREFFTEKKDDNDKLMLCVEIKLRLKEQANPN